MVVLNMNSASIENERLAKTTWQTELLRQVADDLIALHDVPPREVRKVVLIIESGKQPVVDIHRILLDDRAAGDISVFP